MENQIKQFILVLSILYLIPFVTNLVLRLKEENPKPIKIDTPNKIFLYLAIAYIITFILN